MVGEGDVGVNMYVVQPVDPEVSSLGDLRGEVSEVRTQDAKTIIMR